MDSIEGPNQSAPYDDFAMLDLVSDAFDKMVTANNMQFTGHLLYFRQDQIQSPHILHRVTCIQF